MEKSVDFCWADPKPARSLWFGRLQDVIHVAVNASREAREPFRVG